MSVNFNLNRVMLAGRLARDPEIRFTAEGMAVAHFSLAISRDYVNADGNRETDFIRCTAFKSQAQFVEKYFKKGEPMYLEGALRIETYEKEGEKRSSAYVKVDEIKFVAGKSAGASSAQAPSEDKEEEPQAFETESGT